MKLMEYKVEFKTKEMIQSFREVSQYQIERMKKHYPNMGGHGFIAGMTQFGMGRKAGHTDAIIETAIDDMRRGEDTLIITHNHHMAKEVLMRVEKSLRQQMVQQSAIDHKVYVTSITTSWESKGWNRSEIDHILIDGPVQYDGKWKYHLHELLTRTRPAVFKNLQDIVMVGS